MLSIHLTPEQEAKLRERATALGKDLNEYVWQVVDAELAASDEPRVDAAGSRATELWLSEFRAWVASHPRLDHLADDSRDSIYPDREA